MSALRDQFNWVKPTSNTIDGTTTTYDAKTYGHPFVVFEFLTSTNLSVKAGTVSSDAGANRTARSYLLSSTATETLVDPNTATGTVAAQDYLIVPTMGAGTVRLTRAAGSGTVQHCSCPSDAVTSLMVMKLIDGGITAASNTEYADDGTGFTVGTSKGTAVMALADEASTDSVDEGDVGIVRMTLDRLLKVCNEIESGFMRVSGVQATVKFASFGASSAGDNQVVAAVTSKKIRVLSYVIVADGAEVAQWQDGAGTNLSGSMSLAANGGVVCGFNPGGWFETAAGQRLDLNNVGGADLDGHLSYIEV